MRFPGVSALLETFVPERPLAGDLVSLGGHGDLCSDALRGTVTVDDAAVFSARFDGGPIGVFEATRYAGRKNAMRLEINGTLGSLAFDFEEMNVLSFYVEDVSLVDSGEDTNRDVGEE